MYFFPLSSYPSLKSVDVSLSSLVRDSRRLVHGVLLLVLVLLLDHRLGRLVIIAHVLQQVGPHLAPVRAVRAQAPGLFAAFVLQVALQRAPPLVRAAALRTLVAHGRGSVDGRAGDGKHEVCGEIQIQIATLHP